MLLGVKALRRLLSIFVLTLADGIALVLGLVGATYSFGSARAGEVVGLAPLLLAAWISVFAVYRLYDRAASRRNPGALVGAALSWAAFVTLGAAVYPESSLGLGEIVFRLPPRPRLRRGLQAPVRAGHREDLPPRPWPDAGGGYGEGGGPGPDTPDDEACTGRLLYRR
jgi:hypothetical protein